MTKFQDLNLSNAFLFAAMAQDPEACRVILQSVLEREIPQVHVHAEHTVFFHSEYRMIRLDVYGEDALDVQYNIEMQNQNKGNLLKRARYHHAQMDVSSLKPGEDFSQLNPSYVIFICTFDPFGEGLYRYTITQHCEEKDIPVSDGTCTIFFNTKGKNAEYVSEELREFLAYFENSTDEFAKESKATGVKMLHEKVKQVKKDAALEARYMTLEEWMYDQLEEMEERMRAEMVERVTAETTERVTAETIERVTAETIERVTAETIERVTAETIEKVTAETTERVTAEVMAKGMAKGMAQGTSKALLNVLSSKFEVSEEIRERILCQSDVSVLEEWVTLAVKTTSIEEFISKSAI